MITKVNAYVILAVSFSLKIFVWLAFFSGDPPIDSDSFYYDYLATGGRDAEILNLWAYLLVYLGEWGLYNRFFYTAIIIFVSSIIVPLAFIRLCGANEGEKIRAGAIFLIVCYPALYIWSTDVFRDVFITFFTLLAFLTVDKLFSRQKVGAAWTIVFFALCGLSFWLREYLGAALLLSYVMTSLGFGFLRYRAVAFILGLLVFCSLYFAGILDPLILYRGVDGFTEGSLSLGISFYQLSLIELFFNIVRTPWYQLLGVLFINSATILFFLVESVPFLYMFWCVLRNRMTFKSDFFVMNFFVVYTMFWLVGNDNLGTALRLRIPSYIAIAILFFRVRGPKRSKRSPVGRLTGLTT